MLLALAFWAAAPTSAASVDWDAAGASSPFRERAPAVHFVKKEAVAPRPPRVCSALDLSGATWPAGLDEDDRAALTLALNISGSFEGADGWANLSDDFDEQGVSMGLLNQNLGQGSLQPMLIRMRDEHPDRLRALVGAGRLASLLGMLDGWQRARLADDSCAPHELSTLDDPSDDAVSSARNQASVAWARANLYNGGAFVPEWKADLTALASSPEFVSIQLAAAVADHQRAVAYEKQAGVQELRAYLFAFDVVVQDGGFYDKDFNGYAAYLRKHPNATSTARLKELLALRAREVRKRFKQDVLSRKTAIIDGTGRVHGEKRDLPTQYCYDGAWPYRFDSPML